MGAEMPRIPFPAILAIGLFAVAATHAEERRGIRVPIGVPGLSGGETIQKVLDLLTVAALKRSDSKYVDLGYLHKGGGEGEWIGYIGSSQTYLPLDEFELKMLLKIAGMPTPPPGNVRGAQRFSVRGRFQQLARRSAMLASACGGVERCL